MVWGYEHKGGEKLFRKQTAPRRETGPTVCAHSFGSFVFTRSMGNTYRTINTRFWSDGWIRNLNALDRYLFLYLLTNEHVNWCGIYELEIGMMAFESGIDKEDLQKTMLPRLLPKVIYEDEWVFIKNFPRYHTGGINAEKGLKAAMDALPDRIKAKISHILDKKQEKENPLQPPSPFTSTSTSTSTFSIVGFGPSIILRIISYLLINLLLLLIVFDILHYLLYS